MAAEEDVARLLSRELQVEAADAVDRPPVEQVLDRALHEPHEGEEAEHIDGGEHDERERVEGRPELGRLPEEAERDQRARDRAHVQGRARRALADRRGSCALQREMLRRHDRQQRGAIHLRRRTRSDTGPVLH